MYLKLKNGIYQLDECDEKEVSSEMGCKSYNAYLIAIEDSVSDSYDNDKKIKLWMDSSMFKEYKLLDELETLTVYLNEHLLDRLEEEGFEIIDKLPNIYKLIKY